MSPEAFRSVFKLHFLSAQANQLEYEFSFAAAQNTAQPREEKQPYESLYGVMVDCGGENVFFFFFKNKKG